jgi:hypothetical protein
LEINKNGSKTTQTQTRQLTPRGPQINNPIAQQNVNVQHPPKQKQAVFDYTQYDDSDGSTSSGSSNFSLSATTNTTTINDNDQIENNSPIEQAFNRASPNQPNVNGRFTPGQSSFNEEEEKRNEDDDSISHHNDSDFDNDDEYGYVDEQFQTIDLKKPTVNYITTTPSLVQLVQDAMYSHNPFITAFHSLPATYSGNSPHVGANSGTNHTNSTNLQSTTSPNRAHSSYLQNHPLSSTHSQHQALFHIFTHRLLNHAPSLY